VEPSEQSNSTIRDQQVVLQADNESERSDSDSDSDNYHVTAASSSKSQLHDLYDWLADLGMTLHITQCHDAFSTYEELSWLAIVGVGDIIMHTISKGTIYLCSKCDGLVHILKLNNALHILNNWNNLLLLA
jgi:hypothetical protein